MHKSRVILKKYEYFYNILNIMQFNAHIYSFMQKKTGRTHVILPVYIFQLIET